MTKPSLQAAIWTGLGAWDFAMLFVCIVRGDGGQAALNVGLLTIAALMAWRTWETKPGRGDG